MAGETILNIDDSPTVQRLIEMILSSQGYKVILASDGEAGIAIAKAEKPAVILVDFVMPKMNGYQVCKALKEDPEFKDTPIILVTSQGDKVGSKFVDVLGITEYFTKPFQPEELLTKIREVIDKMKAGAVASAIDAKKAPASAAVVLKEQRAPAESVPAGLETIVRMIVEKTLDEFIKKSLPELIRGELAKIQPPSQTGIQGNLASFRIIEVMQLLGVQRQTGKLAISRPAESADIYFRDGAVVYATAHCDGRKGTLDALLMKTCRLEDESFRHVLRIAEMTNQPIDSILSQEKLVDLRTFADCLRRHTESAVYKAMAWQEGEFFFEKTSPPVFSTPLQLKVNDLLLEGARRADEWALIQQKIPSFTLVFEPMIGNAEELTTRGMSKLDMKIFSMIDGKRSVQDIIDISCLSEFDVVKSMFILASVNLIRRRK